MLVKDTKIRDLLVESEQEMESGDFRNSMISSVKAFAHIKSKELGGFSKMSRFRLDNKKVSLPKVSTSGISDQKGIQNVNTSLEKFAKEINELLDKRTGNINDFAEGVKGELAILKLGVAYKAFKSFEAVSPKAFFTYGSSDPIIIDTNARNYTKENSLSCYEFALELALKLQSLDH